MQNNSKKIVKKVFSVFLNIVILFLIVVALTLAYFKVTYSEAYVVGASMYPTLNEKGDDLDIVAINKRASYSYGDIVTIKHKKGTGEIITIVKRIIALEGDYVDIDYNEDNELVVILNGEILQEDYITIKFYKTDNPIAYTAWQEYILVAGEKYVAGKGLLIGSGEVFVLGDNRQKSNDSSLFGPVLRKNITGKVDFVYRKGQNDFIMFIKNMIFKV